MTRSRDRIVPAETLGARVYRKLRGDLRSGVFAAGERLVELDLADRYGVSRTPIREALLQLAREGIVRRMERGYVLPADDWTIISDRLAVRELLDVAVVRGVAERADEACLRGLAQLCDKAAVSHAAGRVKAFARDQQAFRRYLRAHCGNAVLAHHAEMIDDSFQQARARIYEDSANRDLTLAVDRQLVAAITRRDPAAAEAQTRDFLARVRGFYRADDGEAAA